MRYSNVTIAGNGNAGPFDFGSANVPPATISGEVYDDANANGVREEGEPLVPTGTVYLDLDGDGVNDAGEPGTVLAGGRFAIANVTPGTYTVRLVAPPGNVQTEPGRDDGGRSLGHSVAVVAGSDVSIRFGIVASNRVGTASGEVFDDRNGNGNRDNLEPVAPSRVVYLDADNDAALDANERRFVTQAGGTFAFAGLAPGTYVVRAVTPDGFRQTLPEGDSYVVTVAAGQFASGLRFGFAPPGTRGAITGRLFNDTNGNRTRDATETGRAGIVFLDANNDGQRQPGEPTANADSFNGGFYSFTGLAAGTYVVRAVSPVDYTQTRPAEGAYAVTLGPESLSAGNDFGFIQTSRLGTVRGSVFADVDADGVFDTAERLLPGAVVYLDADGDAVLDADEKWAMETGDGYTISGVFPKAYTLRAVVPPGYTQTLPAGGAGQPITVNVAQSVSAGRFGLAPRAGTGTVAGTIYYDSDGDGTRDAGEPAMGGQFVYADLDNDGRFNPGTEPAARQPPGSPVSGPAYTLRLPPGTYILRQQTIDSYAQTEPAARDDNGRPAGRTVTVAASQALTGVDFGTIPSSGLARVTGLVFDDLNGNGTRDPGEAVPAGRVVYVDADNDGVLDPGERRATQIGDQGFVIAELLSGTHVLRVDLPPGFSQTLPAAGAAYTFTAAGGATVSGRNFGLTRPLPTATLAAVDDTYVRDVSPPTIYGALPELEVRKSSTPGLQREAYLRFELAGLGAVGRATLRLFGALQSASGESLTIAAYPVWSNTAWSEDGVSWMDKPPADEPALATVTVTGTTARWYEWDVSDFVRLRQAAGADSVTVALKGLVDSSAHVRFASDEAADAATRPQLLVESVPADDRVAPTVTEVLWGSSKWTGEFVASLLASGMGDGGYRLPDSPRTLPWLNPNKIIVRFSEDVRVQEDDLRATGVAVPSYAIGGFEYDPDTFTATWTFAPGKVADRLRIELDGDGPTAVTDAAGNRLNGAGAGAASDYLRSVRLLAGDATGDGVVNALDMAFVRRRIGRNAGDAVYSPFADLNGDGRTNALDLAGTRQRISRRLPALAPAAAAPASPFFDAPLDRRRVLSLLLA